MDTLLKSRCTPQQQIYSIYLIKRRVHSASTVGVVLLPYLLNSCRAPQKLVYSSSSTAHMQKLSFKNLQLIEEYLHARAHTHTHTHTRTKSGLHFVLVTGCVLFQPNKLESHKHKYVYSLVKNIFSRYCSIQQAWLVTTASERLRKEGPASKSRDKWPSNWEHCGAGKRGYLHGA